MSEGANSTAEKLPKYVTSLQCKLGETGRIGSGAKKCKLDSTCKANSVNYDKGKLSSSESLFCDAGNERDFRNTVASLEDFNSLEQKARHSETHSPENRINYAIGERNDSTVRRSDSSNLRDSSDSCLRDLEKETGTSLICLASSNSQCIGRGVSPTSFHSVGVQRAHSEGHSKNGKRSRLKWKSCDNLQLKKNCNSDPEIRTSVTRVVNSREIDKRNKKNRLFSFPVYPENSSKQDDSKKKRKFLIILKGVLNCKKKKKLNKLNEAAKTKYQSQVLETFPILSNYDRSPLTKRNYSLSSGNLCDSSKRLDKQRAKDAYDENPFKSCSVENLYVSNARNADKKPHKSYSYSEKNKNQTSPLNGSSVSRCEQITASRSRIPEWADSYFDNKTAYDEAPSTHEFLTLLYHESLLQRFVDAPDRCSSTEVPRTGGSRPAIPEAAPLAITGIPESPDQTKLCKKLQLAGNEFRYSSVSDDEDSSNHNSCEEFCRTASASSNNLSFVGDQFGNESSPNTNPSNVILISGSSSSLSDAVETEFVAETNIANKDDETETTNFDEYQNQDDLDSINHNKQYDRCQDAVIVLDNQVAETNYKIHDNDPFVNENLINDNFLEQREESLYSNSNSVINSECFNEKSDEDIYDETSDSSNEISDDETSDSSVDYDVPPIDDRYFDLHYDPYYYHGSYFLDDIPVDQPIDYPSPYAVPNVSNGYIESNNGNWWQQFDGKPGRELYRSQSQPKDLGSHREEEPLDGNLPLHLFLSTSQPLGKKVSPIARSRSNSLESLSSRRRSEVGSLCSSYGSQLYTITEELETEEIAYEEHNPYKVNSCINFGEENFVDFEYANDTSNSCQDIRISKYCEAARRTLSISSGDLINNNEIKETLVITYPEERLIFYMESEHSDMKVEDKICASVDFSNGNCDSFAEDIKLNLTSDSGVLSESYSSEAKVNGGEEFLKKTPSSSMSKVSKENGVSGPVFQNIQISKGLSRSSPNIAVDCESFINSSYFPTPVKRHNIPNGMKEIHTYQNVPVNSKILEQSYCLQNGNGRLSGKISDESNDSDYESNFNSDKYCMMHPEMDRHSLSSSDEYFPTSKSLSEAMSNSMTSGNFSLNLNCDFSFEDKGNPHSCLTSGVASFSAYSSDTSLDFDTFSKSSKVFKWNGSSSISDLTSLSKEFDEKPVPSRGSSSTSDLISLTCSDMSAERNLRRTSYMLWSAQVNDELDNDGDELTLPLNLKSTSSFVFTPHAQAKRNNLMSFYGGHPADSLNSDDDNDEGDSDEVSSSSGSDSTEDDGMMRSYHIGPSHSGFNLGMSENTGLATIAEDVEEDSGGESSSGHWLFSADNTDTDSVIHVPPPLTLASALPIQFENDVLCQHSSSEETLVASEDEVVIMSDTNLKNEDIWKNMMKSKNLKKRKTGKGAKGISDSSVEVKRERNEEEPKAYFDNLVPNEVKADFSRNRAYPGYSEIPCASKNALESSTYSFDTSNVRLKIGNTNFRYEIGASATEIADEPFVQCPLKYPCVKNNKMFENHIDDIFDFSSLDTCEEVSLSSCVNETPRSNKKVSETLMEDPIIFNTSATSEPFFNSKGKSNSLGISPVCELSNKSTTKIADTDFDEIPNINEEFGNSKMKHSEINALEASKESSKVSEEMKSSDVKESDSETQNLCMPLNEVELNCDKDKIISTTHSVSDIQNRFSHSSSDEEMQSEIGRHFTDLLVNQTSDSKNSFSSVVGMERKGDSLNTIFTNGENIIVPSILSSVNGKLKQRRSQKSHQRLRARNVLRHSKTSDGDTDDTDGDCEDERQHEGGRRRRKINSKSPLCNKEGDEAKLVNSASLNIVPSFIEVPPLNISGKDLRISASDNSEGSINSSVVALSEGSDLIKQKLLLPITGNQCASPKIKESNRTRHLVRPLSLGDLRYYSSDSDSEDELSIRDSSYRKMNSKSALIHPPNVRHQFPSSYNASDVSSPNQAIKKCVNGTPSSHSHGYHRPRRYQSLYSPTNKQPFGENSVYSFHRNVERPKPLSLDMAEEFLTQEGLKSPVNKYNPYVEKIKEFSKTKINSEWERVNNNSGSQAVSVNKKDENKNILKDEFYITATSTPDLTDESTWLSAQKQPRQQLLPALPQCSGEPQFTSSSQASKVQLWPVVRVNTSPPAPHSQDCLRLENNKTVPIMRSQVREASTLPDMCERVNRNCMKTFGNQEKGEKYFEKSNLKEQLPVKEANVDAHSKHAGSRGVRFSPSVEEVKWSENYAEADDSDYLFNQMEEKKVTKVKVISSESPPMQKLTPKVTSFCSPPRDSQLSVNNSADIPKTEEFDNNFQNNVNKYTKSVISATVENSNSSEANEIPSLREIPIPESPRSPTPIWQRLKLVKIGSPKGPRPKIPPKPPSLSPRSSDGETPRASSCSSPESGLSSPSSPEFKFKKIPTSPRFFSWGSKKEKKEKDRNNKNSERNSHPKEASVLHPQCSASPTSSSPSPTMDCPQVKRRETQVESAFIINNSNENLRGDYTPQNKQKLPLNPQLCNTNEELKSNFEKSKILNGFHPKVEESENDFLKTRESILKQLKSVRPNLNKVTKIEQRNNLNTSASPSTPSLSLSSDSDSIVDDLSSTLSDAKPPLPPSFQNRGGSQLFNKSKAQQSRRQYLTPNRTNSTEDKDINGNAQSKEPNENSKDYAQPQIDAALPPIIDCGYRSRGISASERLKERFERFSKATRAERERLARSTPDLSQIEESVRRLQPRIDWSGSGRSDPSPYSGSDGDAAGLSSVFREEVRSNYRSSLRGGEAPYRNTFSRVSAEFERISLRNRTRSVGLLETDLDTGASREVLTPQETNLDDLYQDLQNFLETLPQVPLLSSAPKEKTRAKSQSLRHLDATLDSPQVMEGHLTSTRAEDSRAKSMEFLLDDNNRAAAQAPENELMKEGERKVSEAELRVRRSLQRLDVPEWMKTANTPQQGFLLRRRDHTMGATSGGWSAFSSKTGSMTSLGSSKVNTPNTPTKVVIPTRMSTRSYGGIASPSSTTSISPSPSDKGSLFTYPLSRWSTSRINSGTTTPTGSFTSQRTASYARQPYLGWRSNTSLTSLGGSQSSLTSAYLSPAERLALTVIPSPSLNTSQQQSSQVLKGATASRREAEGSPIEKLERTQAADVHSSIKEVTSAIVHYCTETESPRPSPRASPNPSNRAPSPRRRVWVESSFVGSRPITSPETPTSTGTPLTPPPLNGHHEEMVVETRPSHVAENFSFLNYFSGLDHILEGSKSSLPTSINDSTTVFPDSRVDSRNSMEESSVPLEFQKHSIPNDKNSQSENSSRHSTADTINSAISSRGIDSLNSRNSGDSSLSRDSSASRQSSGRGGSREELPIYAGSCEELLNESEGLQVPPPQNSNFLSTDDSTLTASCHSSFGTFQMDEELLPILPETKPKLKLEVATSLSIDTRQAINSRRFSEGASPWEPSSYSSPLEKKSKISENENNTHVDSDGYGFNFSSYAKRDILQEDAHAESTTLEDVLDSLLALPSASRSPSPSGGPHPLSLVRPYTPHSFLTTESSFPSKTDSHDQDDNTKKEDSQYSYLRNQDFGQDLKTQSYHKSISYASSSFAPSSSCNIQTYERYSSEYPGRRNITSQDGDKTSVTFYLGKDEGNYTTTQNDALLAPTTDMKVTDQLQNSFASSKDEDCNYRFQHDDLAICIEKSVPNIAPDAQPLSTLPQLSANPYTDWSDHSNVTDLFGINSYRASETVVERASVELDKPEKKGTPIKEHKEAKVTFHLPPKHMNIPPDSSSENGNGFENFRADIDDDEDVPSSSDPLGMTIHCRNHLCDNTASVEEARASYKTCHNCSVFYCSRDCRRTHWEKHKKFCEKIRATTAAREVLDRVKEDSSVVEFMSSVARRGILSVGRGAVKIFFADASAAEKFVNDGHIHEAHYQALQNIMPQEMGSEIYKKLIQYCRNYNPEIKFILYVSICTLSEPPTVSSSKFRRETVCKCAKLRLAEQNTQASINIAMTRSNHSEHHVITRDLNEPETLLLTTFPDANYGLPPRQTREVAFSNIVRELQERGVNLRTQYADVYRKLAHYVDTGGSFSPLTIYPKVSRRGSSFMCIIMPEADPTRLERVGSNDSKVRTVDISKPHPAIT